MAKPANSRAIREAFADSVAQKGEASHSVRDAFATVPREPFAGPPPWTLLGRNVDDYPTADARKLYSDALVVLDATRGLNIGQPSAHARWLTALDPMPGETVVQIGAGSGYYTAILAELVGRDGRVIAYEIEPRLAERATNNLKPWPQASVRARTGLGGELPEADAVYVCAAATRPDPSWLKALRPGGRLIFPLQAEGSFGGMLKIRRPMHGDIWPARFVSTASFIPCEGQPDLGDAEALRLAFQGGDAASVRAYRTDAPIEEFCWCAGDGWWLSTQK